MAGLTPRESNPGWRWLNTAETDSCVVSDGDEASFRNTHVTPEVKKWNK